ncbi:thiol reductant ABC exporter subunit CydC [Brachybacterium sp. EF45031]|uniref:thiol reductant ABC exporter subunit CydC n=1 Tax=Brachybacterium sillae TaxID=2810536 RepID=UPI00217E75F8|nr:thiol reductant ABC exporter subunit CydC [Brachybacterium sillae]MCS6710837.1 thiol reductant ABC exporter subunit CydC [Brachybacterium sillae]
MSRRASHALARVMPLLQLERPRLLAAIGAGSATLGAAFALAAVSAHLVTRAWTMPPVLDLTVAVVAVRALGVSRGAFRWLERMLTHDVALRGVVDLRANLFARVAAHGTPLARVRRGELLARFGDDAQELGDHVIRAVVPAAVAVVLGVAALVTFAAISLPATLAVGASLLLAYVVAPWAALRAAEAPGQEMVTARGAVTAGVLHVLDDASALRLEDRLDAALDRLDEDQRTQDRAVDAAALPSAVAAAASPAAMVLAVAGSLLAAGPAWAGGTASAGVIGMLVLLPLSSFEAAQTLPAAATQYARSRAAARRLAEVMETDGPSAATSDATSSGSDATGTESDATGTGAPAAPPHPSPVPVPAARLTAHALRVGWIRGRPLTEPVHLDLPSGSRLAIVGPSGAGKSTLLQTLAGLLPPLDGEVLLDGRPVGDLSATEVRSTIVCYAEDAHVFGTTVRENLRVARGDASDEEILAALTDVELDDWVRSLPEGLDTLLGAAGTTVSGGERRRLLLARAVLRRSPLTLLDEPTEHLDPERARRLLHRILDPGPDGLFPPEGTVVVVTHQRDALPAAVPLLPLRPLPMPAHPGATPPLPPSPSPEPEVPS